MPALGSQVHSLSPGIDAASARDAIGQTVRLRSTQSSISEASSANWHQARPFAVPS